MFEVQAEVDLNADHECLVIGVFQKTAGLEGILQEVDRRFDGYISELIKAGEIDTKPKAIFKLPAFHKIGAKRLYFVGLGKERNLSFALLREAFGRLFKSVKKEAFTEISVAIDTFATEKVRPQDAAHAFTEAHALASYQVKHYKQQNNQPDRELERLTVYSTMMDEAEGKAALSVGDVFGQGVNSARTLVNLPGNMLTAQDMADYAEKLGGQYGFEVEILDKDLIENLGMGALLAVNQGSDQPPKMIVLKYQGKEEWTDVIGLVGKGVTFDTGGYSLKTKAGIVGMKTDMGGAAAVLGAMEIIGETKPEQNVVAVIPATDNMISGNALKPDDVITSMCGKTIEVLNTDAEGRLVLADAITYAKHHGANYLVDVATLTGGVITALGVETTGAFTNNEDLLEQVLEASNEAAEQMWRLPIFEKDKERVRNSRMADLNNSPGSEGHAIMGAAFIGEFAEDTPWVHLDIAGTSTTRKDHDLGPAGATGVMARTLALLVERFESLT